MVFVGEATELIMTYGHTYDAGNEAPVSRLQSRAQSVTRVVYELSTIFQSIKNAIVVNWHT